MRSPSAGKKAGVPIETRAVAIPVPLFIRGLQMVEHGRFDSFDSVVAAGLELVTRRANNSRNLLANARKSPTPPVRQTQMSTMARYEAALHVAPDLPRAPNGNVPTSPRTSAVQSAWPILAFTVARLLPVKAVLRAVAEIAGAEASALVDLDSLRANLGGRALGWRAAIEVVDGQREIARGERLATGFPNVARDGERSVRRFVDTYLGGFYTDGRVVGAPFHLGFLNIVKNSNGGMAGMTLAGLSFAQLENPVMDHGEACFPPMTEEEAEFYVRHVAAAHLAEAEQIGEYLLLLRQRPGVGRDVASTAMRRFYLRFWPPNELTVDMVNSLRTAVHSRCQELGLARAEHSGRGASYHLTELGERSLGLLQSLKSTQGDAPR
jgi:hypothetical protein